MPEKRVAKVPTGSEKAAVSVSDMAALCHLSRSRFHALVRDCVFPKPRQDGGRRPYYPHDLIQKCLDIRRTGIGANGQVVLFNRRTAPPVPPASKAKSPAPATASHPELVESLRSLGLAASGMMIPDDWVDQFTSANGPSVMSNTFSGASMAGSKMRSNTQVTYNVVFPVVPSQWSSSSTDEVAVPAAMIPFGVSPNRMRNSRSPGSMFFRFPELQRISAGSSSAVLAAISDKSSQSQRAGFQVNR